MQATAGVHVENLRRHFGATEAVRGLSFEMRPGETLGLLGPNGAGKTTTLAMLAALLPPSGGEVTIFGQRLTRDGAAVKRLVGLAPQEISLYPELSGAENLAFFGRLHGVRGARLRERVASLLARVGLEDRADDRVRTYSGGMKRRLNLACSLVHAPRLLLLDEPTVGVDAHSREALLDWVGELAREGTTVLYTTHYMEEAERLCDRVAIMDDGRIVALGSVLELHRLAERREEPARVDLGGVFLQLTGRALRD